MPSGSTSGDPSYECSPGPSKVTCSENVSAGRKTFEDIKPSYDIGHVYKCIQRFFDEKYKIINGIKKHLLIINFHYTQKAHINVVSNING